MRVEVLREFIEFAKYQNISAAAKKLFITQPALSNHIASIEKELGLELVRHGKTMELTAAGRAFFEGCCEVVGAYDSMIEGVRVLADQGNPGTLVIKADTSGTSGSCRLLDLISQFKRLHPSITVTFNNSSKNSVAADLASGELDCAQVYNYIDGRAGAELIGGECDQLDSIVIDQAPITVVANKDHPLMSKKSISFGDILRFPYAMPAGAAFIECEASIRQLYHKHGAELKNIHYKVVDSIADLVAMETHGDELLIMGASPALPSAMACRSFDPQEYQDFCLIYRKDSDNTVLKEFIEFVRSDGRL